MKHPVWRGIVKNGDLTLCAILAVVILYLLNRVAHEKPEQAIVEATIVGAMLGGAAILLGNWIARYNERTKAVEDLAFRRAQLKMLIIPELVNVAAGLLGANDFIGSARTRLEAEGGTVSLDINLYLPRNMPFTFGLGMELCLLDPPELEALVTLRSNLEATRDAMTDFMAHAFRFQVQGLQLSLRHTMGIAAECFERIDPERKVLLHGREKQGELFSEALRR